jgi:hypothetical protein
MRSEVRMMNYKLQFSPISSTGESHVSGPLQERWGTPFSNWEDAKFFRSWLVFDSFDLEIARNRGRFNWNLLLGMVLVLGISVSFWTGVGVMVALLWK